MTEREHMYYSDLPCWCGGQPAFGIPHKVWHIDNLNCYEAHKRAMQEGDEMRYGWAIAPDGNRYQHNWLRRNGELLDLFGWTGHEDMGRRYVT